jgi:hypothetical protein
MIDWRCTTRPLPAEAKLRFAVSSYQANLFTGYRLLLLHQFEGGFDWHIASNGKRYRAHLGVAPVDGVFDLIGG